MSETMIFLLILGGSHIVSTKDLIDANYQGRLRDVIEANYKGRLRDFIDANCEGRLRTRIGTIADARYNKYWIQLI